MVIARYYRRSCSCSVLLVVVVVVVSSGVVLLGRGTVRQPGIEIVLFISKPLEVLLLMASSIVSEVLLKSWLVLLVSVRGSW